MATQGSVCFGHAKAAWPFDLRYKTEEAMSQLPNNRPEVLPFLPASFKTMLDVGCGIGQFAGFIRQERQAEVWGIEYDAEKAQKAEKILDRVFTGDAQKRIDELPDHYFDLITFNDVLEHLYDPYFTLEKTKSKLTNEGVVFGSIPNIRYFRAILEVIFEKDLFYKSHGIFDYTHVRFFTKKSMIRMFENAGYDVLKIEGINPTKSIRPKILSLLTFGYWDDSQFLQYGILAKPKSR